MLRFKVQFHSTFLNVQETFRHFADRLHVAVKPSIVEVAGRADVSLRVEAKNCVKMRRTISMFFLSDTGEVQLRSKLQFIMIQ